MNRLRIVTSLPLAFDGANSEMYLQAPPLAILLRDHSHGMAFILIHDLQSTYNGVTALALPTARPTILRPRIIPQTWLVEAWTKAPRANKASAPSITFRRPSLSASTPVKGLAINANRLVHDVIRLLSSVVNGRFERSVPTVTKVEEMTPVLEVQTTVSRYPVEQWSRNKASAGVGSILISKEEPTNSC